MLEHQGMRKTSLPTNMWVAIDQGGKSSKGHKELFRDDLGMIESWATARQKEGMIAPNPESIYAEDERDHVTAMSLDFEECHIYGGSKVGEFKAYASSAISLKKLLAFNPKQAESSPSTSGEN